jgi:hypothetical protein
MTSDMISLKTEGNILATNIRDGSHNVCNGSCSYSFVKTWISDLHPNIAVGAPSV